MTPLVRNSTAPTRPDSWSELLLLGRQGDNAALDRLFGEMTPWLFRLALKISGNHADAADIAQQTVVRALLRLSLFDPTRGDVRGWVRRMARNVALNLFRGRRRRPSEPLKDREPGSERDDPASVSASRDLLDRVRRELDAIDPDEGDAVRLYYVNGLKHEELGRALCVPQGTASSRLYRGIRTLRRRLQPVA